MTSQGDQSAFRITLALAALVPGAAIAIAAWTSIDLWSLLSPRTSALAAGIVATLAPVALLTWFMHSRWRPVAAFRDSQIEFIRDVGFRLTPFRIVLLSLAAGIGEELLFRGVLQTLAARHFPTVLAIILPNILFAALHARTAIYALAAFAIGVWLGVLLVLTDSLAAPILTHALYDFAALEWARRAIQSRAAVSSGSSVTG